MRTLFVAFAVTAALSSPALAAPKVKKKAKASPPEILSLGGMEVGQTGFLAFPYSKPFTLFPLKVEDVDEGQFIGSAGRTAVIVRGVKTDGLVSGRYFQLNGAMRVTGTEEISSGATVFVIEPVEPESFSLVRSKSPELEQPR